MGDLLTYLGPILGILSGILGTWFTYRKLKSGEKREYFDIVTNKFQELEEKAAERAKEAEARSEKLETKLEEVETENDELKAEVSKIQKALVDSEKKAALAKRAYEKRIQELETRLEEVERSSYIHIHKHVKHLLWNNTKVGWAFVSHEGIIVEANKTLHKMLGYKPDELHGLHFVSITANEDTKEDMENFVKLMNGEIQHYSMTKTYLKKSGDKWKAKLDVFHLEGETFVLGRVE